MLVGALLPAMTCWLIPGVPDLSRRSVILSAAALSSNVPKFVIAAASAPVQVPTWTLVNNVKMPTLALNTAGLSADDSERAYRLALSAGVSHVDFHPRVERDGVARVVATSKRDDLFLTTKIRKPAIDSTPTAAAEAATRQIQEDLDVLGLRSVDMLLLRDHPSCEVLNAQWAVLEAARSAGKARAIGTVNFCEGSLRCLLDRAKQPPSVNYFMLHAGMGPDAHGLRTFGESKGVRTFAYGALGEPGPSADLTSGTLLSKIGDVHGRTAEEVALRWVLQSGVAVSVRPTADFGLGFSYCKSDDQCRKPMRARADVFSWSLAPSEMQQLDALTSPDGNPTIFSSTGCPGSFFA